MTRFNDDTPLDDLLKPISIADEVKREPRKHRTHTRRLRHPVTTPEQAEEIRRLAAEGWSRNQIMAHLGKGSNAVRRVLDGWDPSTARPWGNTFAKGRAGGGPGSKGQPPLDVAGAAEIRYLAKEGLSVRKIAARIGRSTGLVHKVINGWEPGAKKRGAPKGNKNAAKRRTG